jgi:hypothetical protein
MTICYLDIIVKPRNRLVATWFALLQFWNTIFWQCSMSICIDKRVDDVGFLDKVVSQLPQRLGSSKVRHMGGRLVRVGTWCIYMDQTKEPFPSAHGLFV